MTPDEFSKISKILTDTFGAQKWPQTRLGLVWDKVKDLDAKWFERTVKDAALKFDDRVNFAELAASRRQSERFQKVIKHGDVEEHERSDGKKYFEKLGFKDFGDFLRNKNKGPA
jgi:hypothetical protein